LRLAAAGQGKAAGDVVNQEAVGFALLLDDFNSFFAQLSTRHHFVALDNQVSLARYRGGTQLPAAMAIRFGEAVNGRARHFKIFQDAVVNKRDTLRGNAFIVKLVEAEQFLVVDLSAGSVVDHGEETGQNLFAHLFGESLALIDVLLPVALSAMSEDFMEKNCGCAACQKRRGNAGVVDGRSYQAFHLLAKLKRGGLHGLVVGRFAGVDPVKVVVAIDVHAIDRFTLDKQLQAVTNLAKLQLCALGIQLD